MGYIIEPHSNLNLIHAVSPAISIGRRSDNEFVIPNDNVSRKHLVISSREDGDYIVNKGKTICVNLDVLNRDEMKKLNDNDEIFIAQRRFLYKQNLSVLHDQKFEGLVIKEGYFSRLQYRNILKKNTFSFQMQNTSENIQNIIYFFERLFTVRFLEKYFESFRNLLFYFAHILPSHFEEKNRQILLTYNFNLYSSYIVLDLLFNSDEEIVKFNYDVGDVLKEKKIEHFDNIDVIDNKKIIMYVPFHNIKQEKYEHAVESLDNKFLTVNLNTSKNKAVGTLREHLQNNYLIDHLIGEGGMGQVFKGRIRQNNTPVAIKIIHPRILTDKIAYKRIKREAKILKKLNTEYIPRVYDSGAHHDIFYIIMEYVSGFSLSYYYDFLEKSEIKPIFQKICLALYTVHQSNIIHRDLKPENIMIQKNAARLNIKIIDLGIGKSLVADGETNLTAEDASIGTLYYMAPEQFENKNVSKKSDIYSLGVVLYKLLAKKLPIEEETKHSFLKRLFCNDPPICYDSIPHEFQELVASMLHQFPEERPSVPGILSYLERL
ncbi:protein kinase domain-containing protein [Candidatus Uabimicrobium amorphum]|uniref:Protein kinase n=1 Tax=Uabimicrobium amorphum TaxID=2596890 RepID=A0A5S9F4X1_UABAM|nr:FHA domain-containing serine/threonine-protein kinase [Candidatus Uabimicrobium amorphum]BBM86257.1 protein kinase [Candidatus Uabimicrobium amorphum]